ncbi:MAG: hypothetical protein HKN03_18815, partial [Acidimicrobiales bacterium]|nr:hypothetical protein [Acidimicrobiales bacterium]
MNTTSSQTSWASLASLQALVLMLVATSALVLVGSPAGAATSTTPATAGTALSSSSDDAATVQKAQDEATRDAAAQAVVIEAAHQVKTVWTSEFGVAHPAGLAYDPARATFFVAGTARAGTELLRLDNRGKGLGIVPTPQLGDPATISFDGGEDRLVTVSDRVSAISVSGSDLVTSPRPAGQQGRLPDVGIGTIGSTSFDPSDGAWILLDTDSNTLVRLSRSQVVTRLALTDVGAPELIAVNPADGLLYVMSPGDGMVYALDASAGVQRTFSTAGIALQSPVAMTFAPSTDTTDDPAINNLYIADAGGSTINGGVTEVSLMAVAGVAAATVDTATLVRMTATSGWSPGSPDPSGVVWIPATDRMLVVDSEVDETTGAGWHDVNMWIAERDGSLDSTGTTWGNNAALFAGTRGYSREVTGAGFDPAGNVLYLSDDDARKIFVVRPGPDGQFGNLDDVVSAIDVVFTGSIDTEDPAYEPASGHLFFLDGSNKEIYEIDPVDGVFGNGNDTSSHFDIGYLGPSDWEGLTFDSTSGTLYVGARTTKEVFQISLDGTHLRTIDVSGISGLQYVSGLEIAPSSTGSGVPNLWIVDRGVDNDPVPSENDGKLFEIAISGSELDTAISSGPNGPTATDSATFTFTATVPSATFQCSLDAAPFAACVTPKTYSGLAEGAHDFQVRAVDGGIPDSTPATRNWTVDTVAPDTSITVSPPVESGSGS